MRVVVVASINVDLVVAVEALPAAGETVAGGRFGQWGGGKGANQAVAAARLGADVAVVGAVGRDAFGDEALRALEAEGIDVTGVSRLGDAPTGVAVIVVDAHGENQIAVASGANAELDGEIAAAGLERALGTAATSPAAAGDTPPASPAAAGAATGVVLLGHEVPDGAVAAGARAATAAGWTVVLNPAPARAIAADALAARPILTPNASEAAQLTGEHDPEAAARVLHALTRAPVIVTLGAQGALLFDGDAARRFPAPHVEVIDTTGAGDTVNGALAAELAAGRALEDALPFALRAAALSTRANGAREGMPRRDELG